MTPPSPPMPDIRALATELLAEYEHSCVELLGVDLARAVLDEEAETIDGCGLCPWERYDDNPPHCYCSADHPPKPASWDTSRIPCPPPPDCPIRARGGRVVLEVSDG